MKTHLSPSTRNRLMAGTIVVATIAVVWWWPSSEPGVSATATPLESITIEAPGWLPEDQLRPEMAEALGIGEASPGARRIEILRSIVSPLSGTEHEALLAALLEPRPPGVSEGWFSEYFHRMASLMQRQKGDRRPFARVLATVARDPSRDEVVRDYAIQHLRQVWDRADPADELRGSIEATFRELCSSGSDVRPAALLSLHLLGTPAGRDRIAVSTPASPGYAVDNAELEPLVLGVLRKPPSATAIGARMTASRVAGDRGLVAAGSHLLEIARNRSEHALVRMAAISAIGRIGNSSDLDSVASLEPGDPRVAHAIQSALDSKALPPP